jgi:hypothetical protein
MKYFTPELHLRTASTNDALADEAHAAWERALARYEKHLARIRPLFTSGLKKLTGELRLHDSELLFLGRTTDHCYMALRPEQTPSEVVWLEYALVASPSIKGDVLPQGQRTGNCLFLYDEIDLVSRSPRKTFTHSVLFSNGLHVAFRFRDVRVRVVDQLVEIPEKSLTPAG